MLLYRLARTAVRLRRWFLLGWVAVLAVALALAVGLGGRLQDDFSVPGAEAQTGLERLESRFPMLAGVNGQLVFRTTDGSDIRDHKDVVDAAVDRVKKIEDVDTVQSPLDPQFPGDISADGTVGLAQVMFHGQITDLAKDTPQEFEDAARASSTDAVEVLAGGQVLAITSVPVHVTEVLGVVLALIVLGVTFRSVRTATMPIVSAVFSVGTAMAIIFIAADFVSLSSTTPTLSIMLGLAVGIDYALFILARHRSQLAQGLSVEESVARATATAGTAVVFAGSTVIIALAGLFIVGMPFLTGMGFAAAGAVAMAVLVSVTLLPALLGLMGERVRPKPGANAHRLALPAEEAAALEGGRRAPKPRMSERWIDLVMKRPVLAIAAIAVGITLVAVPAKDLSLGLPDMGTEAAGSQPRMAYDVVAEAFGPGYNTPLLVTVDIINTTDPLGVMDGLAKDIREVPGVADVGISTPNPTGDMGIVQVIPEKGQADPATAELVQELRSRAGELEKKYDISDFAVTGHTAMAVDLSDQLGKALLPFGTFVVGLSLILLTIVFRSFWVPLTAAGGYLLSVLAAFGATTMVFEYGWLNSALGIGQVGAVISFMPIIVMGVLFGLAMDYQVFLVSRMREDYVHRGDARAAVRSGFTSSARVVTAAALIMFAIFAFFVPEGTYQVQPIAFALAVGVAVDAFIVRMTLIPAILTLLGDRAWRLPTAVDRALPVMDVEGMGLEHHLSHEEWTSSHGAAAVRLEDVSVGLRPGHEEIQHLDLHLAPGTRCQIVGTDLAQVRALTGLLSGRLAPTAGTAVIADRALPGEASSVAARTQVLTDLAALQAYDARLTSTSARSTRLPRLVVLPRPGHLDSPAARTALDRLREHEVTVIIGSLPEDPTVPEAEVHDLSATSSHPTLSGATR